MTTFPNQQSSANLQKIGKLITSRIPSATAIERVREGVSTEVYRIETPRERFYLRALPEEEASFAPEVEVHARLRQLGLKVPEVMHFEERNPVLQRSLMITTEIKGLPLSRSLTMLSPKQRAAVLEEAGAELAQLNNVHIEGFGWIERAQAGPLHAQKSTYQAFALEFWEADLAYLQQQHVISSLERTQLEHVIAKHPTWLQITQAHLAHGDLDITHIYQQNGRYSGIIDFGEIRGAEREYDLGHFHLRDGEQTSLKLLPDLLRSYQQINSGQLEEVRIRFSSLLINVRALARSLQRRPASQATRHQLVVLREDLAALL